MAGDIATPELDPLLEQLPPALADLVRLADTVVHGADPDVVRVVWPHQRTVGYGVGPKKMSEHYAYLAVHARHLNLGCNYGARLEDGGLLQGTGANMRSFPVRTAADLDDPRVVPLLRLARRERLDALGWA